MNTGKQINAMIVLLLLLLLLVGIYTIWDPFRADAETERTREAIAARAAHTFARNCRQCHGNDGEGRIGPALNPEVRANNSNLTPFADPARRREMEQIVRDTLTCGRIGTIMPPWSQAQGGSLNDEQIRQLVTLITNPPEGAWEEVAQLSAEENATVPLPPIEQITAGASATGATSRVCGQLAPAAPEETGPVEVKTQWDQVTTDNKFSVTRMGIPTNQQATITVRNNGQQLHNMHVQNVKATNGQDIVIGPAPQFVPAGGTASLTFAIATPGTYNFICDVHPVDMKGTIVVSDAAAASPTPSP
jgi:plastocyanin/mono/diheme cytochrome c family protein